MTPLPRDLHPSNGRRVPGTSGDVVVPFSAAGGRQSPIPDEPSTRHGTEISETTGRMGDDGVTDADEPYPSELQLSILEMLSDGGDDEMIARRVGLDLNTYRAIVAELAASAGACNRFQLALKARDLGWL